MQSAPYYLSAEQPQLAQGVFLVEGAPAPEPAPSTGSRGGFSATTRMLDFEEGVLVTAGDAAQSLGAFDAMEVCVSPSVPVFLNVGGEATRGAGSLYLPSAPHYLQINPGQTLSVIAAAAGASGPVTALPVK